MLSSIVGPPARSSLLLGYTPFYRRPNLDPAPLVISSYVDPLTDCGLADFPDTWLVYC